MKNVVVKITSEKHGAEVIKAFKDLGVDTGALRGKHVGWYYGLFNGVFNLHKTPRSSQVITLEELKAMANPYPKMMWVWDDDEEKASKREVISEIQSHGVKYYITHHYSNMIPFCWRNAKDIEEPAKMKTPMQELINEMEKSPLMFASALTLIERMKLLEKEKEVILLSHINGQSEFDMGARRTENDNLAEQYYNQTFNTKEK